MNFKVFPATIIDGKKIPLIKGWQENASNDPAIISQWQQQFGDRLTLWGIPTGSVNNLFAIDIDVKGDVDGNKSLQDLGIAPEHTAWQRTSTGGLHLIYQYTQEMGNTVDKKLGIDSRGEGGWIAHYGIKDLDKIKPIPEWVEKVVKRKVNVTEPDAIGMRLDPEINEPKYLQTIATLANAGAGERNHTLNTCAYIIGQLVQGGAIDYQRAYHDLTQTALTIGLDPKEIQATVISGLRGAARNPITHPFGNTPPQLASTDTPVNFTIPQAPEPEPRWTPKFATVTQLKDYTKLKRPQLFKDWQPRDIILTSAIGGVGKTTLALLQAVCLATNQKFLNFEPAETGLTLFIAGEDSEDKLYAMLGRICKALGYFEQGMEHFLERVRTNVVIKRAEMTLVVQNPKTKIYEPNQEALDKIYQAVDDLKPKQIVIDPIAMFWGSESGGNDMAMALAKACQRILVYSDASVELISHIGKDSFNKRDVSQFSGRGGTALPNHSRVVRTMLRVTDEEYHQMTGKRLTEGQSAIEVHVSKFSDGSPLLGNSFIIVRDGFKFYFEEVVNKLKSPTTKKLSKSDSEEVVDIIYNYVKNSPESMIITDEAILSMLHIQGVTGARAKAHLTQAVVTGMLVKVPHPDPNFDDEIYKIRNFS